MKYIFLLLFITIGINLNAQTIDYNTQKGYMAKGYDVVAYFDNVATKGLKMFTTTYKGVNYKFVSQKHLNTFKANPNKYIPQYGGYCAYAIATKGEKVVINPEAFEIRDEKLYLFYNAWGMNTLKLWLNESPKKLQLAADKHWETLKIKK